MTTALKTKKISGKEPTPPVNEMVKHIDAVGNLVADVKKTLAQFHSDPRTSFEDKKQVYLNTPACLQNEINYQIYLPSFEDEYLNEYGEDFSWCDSFGVSVYERIDLKFIVQEFSAGRDAYNLGWSTAIKQAFIENAVRSNIHIFTTE